MSPAGGDQGAGDISTHRPAFGSVDSERSPARVQASGALRRATPTTASEGSRGGRSVRGVARGAPAAAA